MSVIVKGMEMPKSCTSCPLHDGETGRCNFLRITIDDYIPKECPLVEVVRCKDCEWWKPNFIWDGKEVKMCMKEPYEQLHAEDFYCASGKKEGSNGMER